jgi:periplasmic divalent cation tolerance protein
MSSEYTITIATCPDKETAKSIAKLLVEQRLAACVQMFPIESIYIWHDKVCDENEVMLLIKSKKELFYKISALIRESHTYEVPEIIQIPIADGLPEYLGWIGNWVGK